MQSSALAFLFIMTISDTGYRNLRHFGLDQTMTQISHIPAHFHPTHDLQIFEHYLVWNLEQVQLLCTKYDYMSCVVEPFNWHQLTHFAFLGAEVEK